MAMSVGHVDEATSQFKRKKMKGWHSVLGHNPSLLKQSSSSLRKGDQFFPHKTKFLEIIFILEYQLFLFFLLLHTFGLAFIRTYSQITKLTSAGIGESGENLR